MATNPPHDRTWSAALRRLRNTIRDLEQAVGEVPRQPGGILKLDAKWREPGRHREEKLSGPVE